MTTQQPNEGVGVALRGHTGAVLAVAWAPQKFNNNYILTGSSDRTARIWNSITGETIHILEGHSREVYGVAWSPSGDRVLTGSWDDSARIWSSLTAENILTLKGHSHQVWDVAWSSYGNYVATASWDRTTRIWDASSGILLKIIAKHPLAVLGVDCSPSGNHIVSCSTDKSAVITQTISGKTKNFRFSALSLFFKKNKQILRGHSDVVYSVSWSPGGDYVASGSADRAVRVWEVSTACTTQTLQGHSDSVWGVAWSPSAEFIISGSYDRTARIWSFSTGKTVRILHHDDWVNAVAWSPGGDEVVTASSDYTARIIRVALKRKVKGNSEIGFGNDITQATLSNPYPPLARLESSHSSILSLTYGMPSSERPKSLCFRYAKVMSFEDALTKLLKIDRCPEKRPDLEDEIPDEIVLKAMLREANYKYKEICDRPETSRLIQTRGLTTDEVKAIVCYTMEDPYRVYAWLNGWLMSNERDAKVKENVGPFFLLLYRGMEKLPRLTIGASRGVIVRDIQPLRETFDDSKNKCKIGSTLSFWGVASFSTEDQVSTSFAGTPEEDAIIYSCGSLDCVSIQPFSETPGEFEVMPMPPSIFEVNTAHKVGRKLVVAMIQKDHNEVAYVVQKQG